MADLTAPRKGMGVKAVILSVIAHSLIVLGAYFSISMARDVPEIPTTPSFGMITEQALEDLLPPNPQPEQRDQTAEILEPTAPTAPKSASPDFAPPDFAPTATALPQAELPQAAQDIPEIKPASEPQPVPDPETKPNIKEITIEPDGTKTPPEIKTPSQRPTPPKPPQKEQKPKADTQTTPENANTETIQNRIGEMIKALELKTEDPPKAIIPPSGSFPKGEKLNGREISRLKQELNAHWKFDPGIKWPEKMVITLRVSVSQHGKVTKIAVINLGGVKEDRFFRSAVRQATKAVKAAEPYSFLPQKKYADWQTIIITFDPRRKLGFR